MVLILIIGSDMKKDYQEKLFTRSVFQFTPEGSELKEHGNGDVELKSPTKGAAYKKLGEHMAKVANEHVKQKYPEVPIQFEFSEVLRRSTPDSPLVMYSVFTTDKNAPDDILKEVDSVCLKHMSMIFKIKGEEQKDLFKEETKPINVDISGLSELAGTFVKDNDKFDLNTPITISSDFSEKPQKDHGEINKPTTRADNNVDSTPQKKYYIMDGIDRSKKKITVREILFVGISNPTPGESETLIAVDANVIKEVCRSVERDFFFIGVTIKGGTKNDVKNQKVLIEVELWEGPKFGIY